MGQIEERKTFARTIRMKERIRLYVEQQEGSTFSEQFENMVLFCMESEAKINKSLDNKKAQLDKLEKEIARYSDLTSSLRDIKRSIDRAVSDCKSLDNKGK